MSNSQIMSFVRENGVACLICAGTIRKDKGIIMRARNSELEGKWMTGHHTKAQRVCRRLPHQISQCIQPVITE